MDEFLTMEEIEARYAPDWVLIAEPQTNEMQQLLGGKVASMARIVTSAGTRPGS